MSVPAPAQGPVLVLGLGNPGSRYRDTRHNLGFRVVSELAHRRGITLRSEECGAVVADDAGLTLAQPQTYMNRSGYAARCLAERRGVAPAELLVVYDDVHLPLGRLRLRPDGGPGGHRGMESVIQNLQTEGVPRLRLGVGRAEGPLPGEDLVQYVLSSFERGELEAAEELVRRGADAVGAWLAEGIDAAMNRYNP